MVGVKRIMTSIKPLIDTKRLHFEHVDHKNCYEYLNYLGKVKTRNEPYHNALKRYLNNSNCSDLFESQLYKMVLRNGLGVIVRNTANNKIIGAAMNNILTPIQLDNEYSRIRRMPDKVIKDNLFLLNYHTLNSGILNEYSNIFEIRILSIDNKYEYSVIAKELLNYCEKMAERKGFQHIKIDAVNKEAQKFLESQHYIMFAYTGYTYKTISSYLFGPNLQLFFKSLV